MSTVGNSLLKCQLHKFLRWRTHILIPLPERNNGKSHTFQILYHQHCSPTVKRNFFYMVLRSKFLNEFLYKTVMNHISFCGFLFPK